MHLPNHECNLTIRDVLEDAYRYLAKFCADYKLQIGQVAVFRATGRSYLDIYMYFRDLVALFSRCLCGIDDNSPIAQRQ